MALTKKQFAKKTFSISNSEFAKDPTAASGPQKLVLEAAYGVYVAEAKKYAEQCEVEKNELRNELLHLKVELEAQRGETRVERTRLQAVGYLAKRGLIGIGEIATTPFSAYRALPAIEHDDFQLKEKKIKEVDGDTSTDSAQEKKEGLKIEEELPSGWRFPIAIVSRFFERLSPLSTAILFALVVAGGTAYGKFSTYVADQRLQSVKGTLEDVREELKNTQAEMQKLEGVDLRNKELEREMEGLQRDIGTLSDEKSQIKEDLRIKIEEHQAALREKLEEYEASIAAYRDKEKGAAATEAAKQADKILQLTEQVGELKGKNILLNGKVKELQTNYETTTTKERDAQADAKLANDELIEVRRELTDTNAERRELSKLLGLTKDAIYAVEKYFGRNNLSQRVRRACYRIEYVSIADKFPAKAAVYGLPADLSVDNYKLISDYPESWVEQCPK